MQSSNAAISAADSSSNSSSLLPIEGRLNNELPDPYFYVVLSSL